jgi:hypothetical protein
MFISKGRFVSHGAGLVNFVHHSIGPRTYRRPNERISTTATYVPLHGCIDAGIARIRIAGQEGRRHNLTGLATTTLNDFKLKPSALDLFPLGVSPIASIVVTTVVPRLLIAFMHERVGVLDQHGARANTAPNLCARHTEHIAERAKQSISPSPSTVCSTPFTLMRKGIGVPPFAATDVVKKPHRGRVVSPRILLSELISERMARAPSLTFQEFHKRAHMRLLN